MKSLKNLIPFKRDRKGTVSKPTTTSSGQHPLVQMRSEMDRMFDLFFADPFGNNWTRSLSDFGSWYGDFSPASFAPTIDIADEKKHLRVTAELPGMEEKDIHLTVHDDSLSICGEKKVEETSEEDGYYRTERSYGSFERTIPLPVEVDTERAEATFKKGVLSIRLPKTATARAAKKVPIRSSQ